MPYTDCVSWHGCGLIMTADVAIADTRNGRRTASDYQLSWGGPVSHVSCTRGCRSHQQSQWCICMPHSHEPHNHNVWALKARQFWPDSSIQHTRDQAETPAHLRHKIMIGHCLMLCIRTNSAVACTSSMVLCHSFDRHPAQMLIWVVLNARTATCHCMTCRTIPGTGRSIPLSAV